MICISEYGLKILNVQAASAYEVNLGVRDNLDTKPAMLSNSLFLDFLLDNGLEVWKGESTRMIVGINFDYGSRSFEQEEKHLKKLLKDVESEERRLKIQTLLDDAIANKDKYDKKSKQELREIYYRDGVDITYNTHNKAGEIIKSETRHYKMLYRTPGKAKKEIVFSAKTRSGTRLMSSCIWD